MTCSKVSFDVCFLEEKRRDLRCWVDPYCDTNTNELYYREDLIRNPNASTITQFFMNDMNTTIRKV